MESRPRFTGATASRRKVVERAEAYVRRHIDTKIPVPRLSRIVGLSERGLRNAFYSVRGVSPKRCMLAYRLQCVRKALCDAWISPITVTDAAVNHGFYELGRFAATYKAAFGEAPSETLRGAGRTSATEHRNGKKVQRCLHEPAA